MSYVSWKNNQDAIAIILSLRDEGISFSEIALRLKNAFGMDVSANAVRKKYVENEAEKKKVSTKSVLQDIVEQAVAEEMPNYKETIEISGDGTHKSDKLLRMSAEQTKDVSFILDAHGYDPEVWELMSARNNIWNSYSKQDGIMTLYSSKITVRPKKEEDVSFEDMRGLYTEMMDDYQRPVYTPSHYSINGKLLELNIADLHLGKLAWSGDANDTYDHEIAKERFFYIINDVLTKTKDYRFEKILFIWSNDFFHIDSPNVTTTAGTRQDASLKFAQMFKMGVRMLVEAIDLLSQFAPVETMYIGSNHDKLISYFATEYLYAWYRKDPNVKVDADPKIRKYVRFGKCLIGFTHGHAEGKRIGKVMPIEAKQDWGETLFHEMHAGHFHSEKTTTEDNGTIVRYLGSPTGSDTWHYESGYVGAVKKGQSFVWDKEKGLELMIFSPVERERVGIEKDEF
jgi:hypothetical protein